MKNEEVAALMEAMEARFKEHSEDQLARFTSLLEKHRSATSDQISQLITPIREAKRKRSPSSSLSVIPTDTNECLGFENLPREVVAEIMSRLSTESLMRFKCLNKSWYFVIRCLVNDPGFVAKHQSWAEAHPIGHLVNEPPPNTYRDKDQTVVRPRRILFTFITSGEEGKIGRLTKDIDVSHLPSSLVGQKMANQLQVCHCNGIVCFSKDCRTLTLYNPAMGEFSTFHPKLGDGESKIGRIGFGSDSAATKFKFVRILNYRKAQVFCPGSPNTSWREIGLSVHEVEYHCIYKTTYLRGYCFWLIIGKSFELMCLCFDVARESFHALALPVKITAMNGCRNPASLTVRDGLLCFFSHLPPVQAWMMDIDGSFTWRKWMKIGCFSGESFTSVSFLRSGELLLRTCGGDIVSYNVGTKKSKKLFLSGSLGQFVYLGHYVHSLAAIKWMTKCARW